MNVKIVTRDVNKLEYLQDCLTQTGQDNELLKSDIKIDWIWRKYGWKVIKIRQKIEIIYQQSLTPWLLALEKKEPEVLKI